ncbi:MAG: DUF934 domain-containing protein [Piscinibacter sp.]|nr:DUF934 domain-containing protein [Piscinibacter sp.]
MKFVDLHKDPWHPLGGEDGPPVSINPDPHLLLDLAQWHAVRASWPAGVPVGVRVPNDHPIEDLAADLPRLSLVALHFPKWTDGRAYSQARLLRSRWRFAGEVRATGEVLVDMLPLLQRTGVDAVVLRADQSREAAQRALSFFPGHYQGDVRDNRPLFAQPAGTAERLAQQAQEFVNGGASI